MLMLTLTVNFSLGANPNLLGNRQVRAPSLDLTGKTKPSLPGLSE
jgi:hypothetical protein